jgi:hypothetical protein
MHLPRLSNWNTLKIGSKYITTDSQPSSIAHSIICTQLFRGKMRSDWLHAVAIQVRGQRGEDMEYWYPSGLEKTISKWDIYVLLVMKGLSLSHIWKCHWVLMNFRQNWFKMQIHEHYYTDC